MPLESISAAKTVFDLISSVVQGYSKTKKEFHDHHVEPLFRYIEKIHRDYTAGFQELRIQLNGSEYPTADAIAFLRARRRDLEVERIHAVDLADVLSARRMRFGSDFNWLLVEKFCSSCSEYMKESASISSLTWYSSFVGSLETYQESNRDLNWQASSQIGISGDPRSELISKIDHVLDHVLPRNFSAVSRNYAKLRSRLL